MNIISVASNTAMIILAIAIMTCAYWPKKPEGWSITRWKIFLALLALASGFQLIRVCVSNEIEEPWIDKMVVFFVICRTYEYCASRYGEKVRKLTQKAEKSKK